jgi:hypothetical protein
MRRTMFESAQRLIVAFAAMAPAACSQMYNPPVNPNVLNCYPDPGVDFAFPLHIETDCWENEPARFSK